MLFPDLVVLVPMLLVVAVAGSDLRGDSGRAGILRWRPLVRLGEWSFALYLVHAPVLYLYYTSTTPGGWPSPAVTSSPQLVTRLPGGVRRGRGRAAHRVRATDRAVDPTAGTRPVIRRACGPGAGAGAGTARQGRHRVLVRPDGGSVLTGGD
jgi:hypothetical protein